MTDVFFFQMSWNYHRDVVRWWFLSDFGGSFICKLCKPYFRRGFSWWMCIFHHISSIWPNHFGALGNAQPLKSDHGFCQLPQPAHSRWEILRWSTNQVFSLRITGKSQGQEIALYRRLYSVPHESGYTPPHVGHNAGTCPRHTIGLPPTPLPCTSGRLDGGCCSGMVDQSSSRHSSHWFKIVNWKTTPNISKLLTLMVVGKDRTPQHHWIDTIHWWFQSILEKCIWPILYPQTHQWQTAAARDRNGNRAVPSTTTAAASTHAEWMA